MPGGREERVEVWVYILLLGLIVRGDCSIGIVRVRGLRCRIGASFFILLFRSFVSFFSLDETGVGVGMEEPR